MALELLNFLNTWEQRKLGDLAVIIGGGTPDTNNPAFWNGNINWFSPSEITGKNYVHSSNRKISTEGLKNSSAKLLPANKTILFSSRATIGEMSIITEPSATNQGFQSFVVKEGVDLYFLFSSQTQIKRYALRNASGSTFLEVSKSNLEKMPLVVPSFTEQSKIGTFFQTLDTTITLHQRELPHH